ncbi:MAG TPA: hypothetical protein VM286_05365 [Candidatus Thermoplasmatota archaeon]|nr:hypothetical protein [Candidatus Thermoplasmatota archaeon]
MARRTMFDQMLPAQRRRSNHQMASGVVASTDQMVTVPSETATAAEASLL